MEYLKCFSGKDPKKYVCRDSVTIDGIRLVFESSHELSDSSLIFEGNTGQG